jgi:chromosome segregation ATPase
MIDNSASGVLSSADFTATSSSNATEKDFRRELKLKDKEIDRLNAECLELEDQVSAVKKEVESAWKAYKTSQEQAAERESDLQDEMRQIQKAKQTDKEQLAVQISDAAKEVEEISRQLRTASAERNDLQEKIDEMVTYSQVCDHLLENIIIYP